MSAIYYLLKPVEADDLKDALALFEKNKLKQNYSVLIYKMANFSSVYIF
jgi:response regulator of citrate/malate metabolism